VRFATVLDGSYAFQASWSLAGHAKVGCGGVCEG
jgi:hypothetical protein